MQTATILEFPKFLSVTANERLLVFADELVREMGQQEASAMLLREGYRVLPPREDSAQRGE